MSMDNTISLLEKRIEELELQVLPVHTSSTNIVQSVTDLLLQSQTMIKSALSCREGIISLLQHTATINEYLDPNHASNDLEIEAKRRYLVELYPEIRDTIHTVSAFERLVPFIDSANIEKIIDLSEKLEHLAASNLTLYNETRDHTLKVLKSLQQYNDISMSIKLLFGQLDSAILELEEALQPKFVTEE